MLDRCLGKSHIEGLRKATLHSFIFCFGFLLTLKGVVDEIDVLEKRLVRLYHLVRPVSRTLEAVNLFKVMMQGSFPGAFVSVLTQRGGPLMLIDSVWTPFTDNSLL